MATAAVEVPPSNILLPGSHLLPTPRWPEPSAAKTEKVDPGKVVSKWVDGICNLTSFDEATLKDFFSDESYWRDLLCFSWDFRTLQGPKNIETFLKSARQTFEFQLNSSAEHKKPQLTTVAGVEIIQAFLKVDTKNGRGDGLVRLVKNQADGIWRAFTLFTSLKELKGYKESTHSLRPSGIDRDSMAEGMNWKDRRSAQLNFEGDREPAVLILGTTRTTSCEAPKANKINNQAPVKGV